MPSLALSVNVVPVTLSFALSSKLQTAFEAFWVSGDSLIFTCYIYNRLRLYSAAFTRCLAHFVVFLALSRNSGGEAE